MHLFQLDVVAVVAALLVRKNVLKLSLSAHQSANAHKNLPALKRTADAKNAAHHLVGAAVAVNSIL